MMSRSLTAVIALCLIPAQALSDGTLISWGPRDLQGMTEERFNDAKKRSVPELLELNLQLTTWPEAYELLIGVMQHRKSEQLQAGLIAQITQTDVSDLKLTSRLVVWERISSSEILFEGKGLQVDDDLFMVAGRANWCLRTMTDRNFGIVRPNSTKLQLQKLEATWGKFLDGDKIDDESVRFPSKKTGLTEIRSPEAIHALITSLKPSKDKSEYLHSTLKKLYGLDALPEDKDSPAHFCNPDTYTHRYLASVTQVTEQQSSEWWSMWWEENKDKLVWDSDSAKFKTK